MKSAIMEKNNKLRVRNIFLGLLFVFVATQLKAGAPSWSVNPADYQYSMTVTAVLDANCSELSSTTNILGAFVNGQCRGKITSSTVYNGKYLAMLTIYSNAATGEAVSFKIYEASADAIHAANNAVTFENNGKLGALNAPYSVFTNSKPTNITLSSASVDENSAAGTSVGTLSSTDTDVSDTHTYAFATGTGDGDNSKFTIAGNKLQVNAAPDYEVQASYSVLIKTVDNKGCSFAKQFTVSLNNINDQPTNIVLSNSSLAENSPSATSIGILSTQDQDAGNTFTYSLVTGTGDADNLSFIIDGNTLKSNTFFDYETRNTFNIRVKTNDGNGGTFEKAFTINCTNANDAPTAISLSISEIVENLTSGTTVGTFSTTDPDPAGPFTYSFVNVNGSDNASFVIVGDQLKTNASFNFEEKNLYTIYVKTIDNGGASFDKQLMISIVDGNDFPTDLSLSNQTILSGKPIGTVIGSFTATDVDANDSYTYSLISGAGDVGNDSFNISGSDLVSKRVFAFKPNKSFSIRVKVEDGKGGSFARQFTIQIKDINNGPSNITLSSNAISEGASLGTIVGSFNTTDSNSGDGHTYSFEAGTGGENNSAFAIVSNTLRTNASFNYEKQSSYSILVKTEDSDGGSFTKQFTISVTDANDIPHSLKLSNLTVEENMPAGTSVGVISAEDEDTGDTHTYSLANSNSNDNAKFKIEGNALNTNAALDFEVKESYQIEIKTDDGKGGVLYNQFYITILNKNDAPTSIQLSKSTIEENKPAGTIIGSLTTSDQDAGESYSYSLIAGSGGEDNNSFAVSGTFLTTKEVFKFNSKTQYSILVETKDSKDAIFTKQFIVLIVNDNDAPTAINLDENVVDENAPSNTYVGTFTSIDEDLKDKFKYSLVTGKGGKDNASFKLDGNKLLTAASFDFEAKSALEIRIKTEDSAGVSFESPFVINVNDINEKPQVKESSFTIAENFGQGETVGTVQGSDSDKNQALIYFILTTDSIPFQINPSNGVISLSGAIDYETTKEYIFQVAVKDNGLSQLSDTASIKISITDKVEGEEEVLPANNYMSPNGDGKNDAWVVEDVVQYKEFELRIFNGSGELIYHRKSDYQNDWDGTFNGKTLPTGYYMYYFKKDKEVFKGIISIIR